MTPITVVIADDHFLVREGLRRLLADGDDVRVVAEVGTAVELLDAVHRLRPDAVLTDIRMPPGFGTEGIDAALRIRAELPGTGVVVLSQHADAAYVQALFRSGTAGLAYLLKERVADRDGLVSALVAVVAGDSVVDPKVVDALVAGRRQEEASPLRDLTARELEVLREMAGGRSNAAIGRALFISESAVSKHIGAIFTKLRLSDDGGTDRRVRAVLAYVTSTDAHGAPRG